MVIIYNLVGDEAPQHVASHLWKNHTPFRRDSLLVLPELLTSLQYYAGYRRFVRGLTI